MYNSALRERMEEALESGPTLGPIYRGMKRFFGMDPEPITDISVIFLAGPNEETETVKNLYESIKAQNFYKQKRDKVDIIGVCNGAPEETVKATKDLTDDFVYSETPLGYSDARNAGRVKATQRKGRRSAILCMDTDMEIKDPYLLDKIIESLNKGYVGGLTNMFPDSDRDGEGPYFAWSRAVHKMSATLSKVPIIGKYVPPFGNSFVYFRNDVNAQFRTDLGASEDVDFVTQLRKEGPVDYIDSSGFVASGRRVRKDGALASWMKRGKRYLDYINGNSESLAATPEPAVA